MLVWDWWMCLFLLLLLRDWLVCLFDCSPESDKLYRIFTGVVRVSDLCCDVLALVLLNTH